MVVQGLTARMVLPVLLDCLDKKALQGPPVHQAILDLLDLLVNLVRLVCRALMGLQELLEPQEEREALVNPGKMDKMVRLVNPVQQGPQVRLVNRAL